MGESAARAFAHWPNLRERLIGLANRDLVNFEIDGPETDRGSSFDATISPLGDGVLPSGWVVVLRDVTLQKRAELAHERMLREQAARTLAEATNLAGTASWPSSHTSSAPR